MKNLADYTGRQASFFEKLQFEFYQHPTTDYVRRVCWLHRLPAFKLSDSHHPDKPTAPFRLVLTVDYDLCIGDAASVPTSANYDYHFEGVRLELRDINNDQPLGTLRLNITTVAELKALVSTFPSYRSSRRSLVGGSRFSLSIASPAHRASNTRNRRLGKYRRSDVQGENSTP